PLLVLFCPSVSSSLLSSFALPSFPFTSSFFLSIPLFSSLCSPPLSYNLPIMVGILDMDGQGQTGVENKEKMKKTRHTGRGAYTHTYTHTHTHTDTHTHTHTHTHAH